MIDQDYKFFRENFSASSFSEEASPYQSFYPTTDLKLPSSKRNEQSIHKSQREYGYQSIDINEPKNSRTQGKLSSNWVDAGKQVQLKILQKLKSEHKGIKQMNISKELQESNSRQSAYQQQKTSSVKDRNERKNINQSKQATQFKQSKIQQNQTVQQQTKQIRENSKKVHYSQQVKDNKKQHNFEYFQGKIKTYQIDINSLNEESKQKDILIKRLRDNQASMQEKYNNEIRNFQTQYQQSIETISALRKQIVQKDTQINLLKNKYRQMTSNQDIFRLQQQIQILRTKENEHLKTIQSYEQQSLNRQFSQGDQNNKNQTTQQISTEISKLRQILIDRDERWTEKLNKAIENQRKINLIQLQKLLSTQNINTSNTMRISQNLNDRTDISNSYQQITFALDQLLLEIQQLKKNRTESSMQSVLQDVNFIKNYITKLQVQKVPRQSSHRDRESQAPQTPNAVNLLQAELANYKKFLIEQQNTKRLFLQQLDLYKQQTNQTIKQNTYLRQQLGTLELNLNKPTSILSEDVEILKRQIEERNNHIIECQQQIEQLQHQLINSQPQKPMILNRNQDTAQLHAQIQRLQHLAGAESDYFMKVHTELTQYFQNQMALFEQRVRLYEQHLQTIHNQLRQNEIQIQNISNQSKASANLFQFNQILIQQTAQLRGQVMNIINVNRQYQVQLQEQSQQVDMMWQTKQAELHSEMQTIQRMKNQ